MKPTAAIFAVLTAAITVQDLEIEHHDHTNPSHESLTSRSNHLEHHTTPEADHTVVARGLLLEFSTRELVEELEARIKDSNYNHVERRDPSRFTNWVRKQVGKVTGGGGHQQGTGTGGYGGGGAVDDASGMGGAGVSDVGTMGP